MLKANGQVVPHMTHVHLRLLEIHSLTEFKNIRIFNELIRKGGETLLIFLEMASKLKIF